MENLTKKLTQNCIKKGKIEGKLNELYRTMTFSKSYRTRVGIQKHINRLEKDVEICDKTSSYCKKNGASITI